MSLNIDTSKVDLGFVNPPVGRANYTLGKATMAKSNKGEEYVLLPIKNEKGNFSVSFWTSSQNEVTARIAVQNLTKVWFAAGLDGAITDSRLKNLEGKRAELDFQLSKDGKFVNIAGAYPVSEESQEEEEQEEESAEEAEEQQEENSDDDTPPSSETPAWLKKKK